MKYYIEQKRETGFVSSLNIVVGSLKWLDDNSIVDFYIDWNNPFYQTDNSNLFDKFFFNQKSIENYQSGDTTIIDAMQIGHIHSFLHDRNLSERLHKILIKYGHFDNPIWKKCNEESVYKENTLGVHVRKTDHWVYGELLDNELYYRVIDSKLKDNNYQNILLITDEYKVVEEFVSNYGDMIILNKNIYRSDDQTPVYLKKYSEIMDELAEQIMIEAISLSRCEEIIITWSNISIYSLMLNPQIKFEQIDRHINYR